jgi:flap endonuclease-1
MGVDLSDIVVKRKITIKDLANMTVAIDAYNIIYQFLSSIRQPDGTPLMDRSGNVTSHLSGIFYRTITMLENEIKPVYVFDGKPFRLKNRTLEERRIVKEKNISDLEKAREEGDVEKIRSLSSRINYINGDMIREIKELLTYMGIPYVQAPTEGEAQASWMNGKDLVQGVISQDYDCLLFGAKQIYRNITIYGRRKVSGKNIYINVTPEVIDSAETFRALGMTRENMIDVAVLVGTDFNTGIDRVGARTAVKLIRKYGTIEEVLKAKNREIENLQEIKAFFMNPPVEENPDTNLHEVKKDEIFSMLCDRHDFSRDRVSPYIANLEKIHRKASQFNLDSFF